MKNGGKRRGVVGLTEYGSLALFVVAVAAVAAAVFGLVWHFAGRLAVAVGVTAAAVPVVTLLVWLLWRLFKRRKVDRPVAKILNVTEHMARGEFDTDFTLAHEWGEYDVFDFILENLSLTAEELKRGEQRRSDFVANVSHELKTPLAIVTNCADVLRQEGLPEERRREYAEILHAAAGRLSALVSNVLKLDKLENGSMPPEAKKFDLGESLAQCVLQFEDAAERKGLNFACEIEEGAELVSDESLLSMIWTNLLSNAVKFTDAGGTVFVTLRREEGGACVEVRDTGCGMSAETGAHIFDKFYQGDTSHAQEGNGLGLALVKKAIDLVGGEIVVESAPGEGSRFTVRLHGGA